MLLPFRILYLLISLIIFSCTNETLHEKGEFNDVIILASSNDRKYLEPILNEYLFYDSLKTPQNEPIYKAKWITFEDFHFYKYFSNICILSLTTPPDKNIDVLIEAFEDHQEIESYPIILKDLYEENQNIFIIKEDNYNSFVSNLDTNLNLIISNLNFIIDYNVYEKLSQNPQHPHINNLILEKFKLSMVFDSSYKIIRSNTEDSDLNLLWIGKGTAYSNKTLYQWLLLSKTKKLIQDKELDNVDITEIIENNIDGINNGIEIVNFGKFFNINLKNKKIYKINGMANHISSNSGGPFSYYIIDDQTIDEYINIFTFVNYPGHEKYPYIKELETIINHSIF